MDAENVVPNEIPSPAPTRNRVLVLGLLGLGGALVCALAAWQAGVTAATVGSWLESGRQFLSTHPAYIFLSIVILPALGFPVSVLLVMAGVVYGERFGLLVAGLITLAAMMLNLSWTYWLARYPGRRFISALLERTSGELPALAEADHIRMTVIARITPGIPFFVQNYSLGLARVPVRTYFLVSFPAQIFWTFGFVISGGAIFEGRAGTAIAGIGLLVAAVLLTQMVRRRFGAGG